MTTVAHRLHTVEEYYFSRKLREVRDLITQGKPVINMGIGSPDLKPPIEVINAMISGMNDEKAHQYQSYQGIPELRTAIKDFYHNYYKVNIDANNEVLPLMGSKEGIMHISMAFLNPGDKVLIPNPGYPTYTSVTKLVGAVPVFYELTSENDWLPNFEQLQQLDLSEIKLMWLNYPHMPTGSTVANETFKKLVAFAKTHGILLVNDNPYSFILNDNPQSILRIQGAKDVAIELNSLSKSFNISGWRVGMAVSSAEQINAILKVKSNMDSGMFYGIQKGAVAALKSSKSWFDELNVVYQKRRTLLWKLADLLNCTYDKKSVGMFVWAKLPQNSTSSEAFIDELLYKKNIFIAPGTVFGSKGEGYIRFSLCVPENKIEEALTRFKN